MPEDYKCSFANTLIDNRYGCANAISVVRRGGADVACQQEQAHLDCARLFDTFKQATLEKLDMEDDLNTVPHSLLVKIQLGGLLGLQQLNKDLDQTKDTIEDIHALVCDTCERYDDVASIPCNDLVKTITRYKLRKRRS